MQLRVVNKICTAFLAVDPVAVYKIAKSNKNNKLKEQAKDAIKTDLIAMGYGKKNFGSFSKEEQKKILKYLQCLEGGLLDFLERIKKPD